MAQIQKGTTYGTTSPSNLVSATNLNDHVDYETQFEKTFIDPLTTITNTIGWKLEEISTLEDLFV